MTKLRHDDEITPDLPYTERMKWLISKGVTVFSTGSNSKGQGLITFCCADPNCLEEHLLEIFPSDAEAHVALKIALRDCGLDVEDGGILQEGGEA